MEHVNNLLHTTFKLFAFGTRSTISLSSTATSRPAFGERLGQTADRYLVAEALMLIEIGDSIGTVIPFLLGFFHYFSPLTIHLTSFSAGGASNDKCFDT